MINVNRKTDRAIVVEGQNIQIVPVRDESAEALETQLGLLRKEDAQVYVDASGGLTYLYNVDLPAKVEAENLRNLRRSVALKRAFEFNTSEGKIDWMKIFPYIIVVMLILFK
ncbi:hypothetical protein [Paenibacillus alvei]|uniref:hypothetical protein n=1 Tax=Paenibacillus alvei TaxID=44250 RepID=UPI00227F9768|nr:hypothetical protein [Paenibacillus alvei]MCY7487903.1 hypothetical protein [Paenibacillus alvei]